MMLDYAEQRDFPRMAIDCPAQFIVKGADGITGSIVKNLSGGGILMWIDNEVEVGTTLSIEIAPGKDITPSLSAEVEVVRAYPVAEGNFAVACQIKHIVDTDAANKDFSES